MAGSCSAASVEAANFDFYPAVGLQALDQLRPGLLHVAVDQRLAAAFALGYHQFGGHALAAISTGRRPSQSESAPARGMTTVITPTASICTSNT